MRFTPRWLLALTVLVAAFVNARPNIGNESASVARDSAMRESQAAPAKPKIAWRRDLAAARKEAVAKKQPILLVIAFPTCKWWLRMERTTFTDPRVRELVGGMVPVLLHGAEDGKLFAEFGVTECPLIALLDPNGKERARAQGLQEPGKLVPWLKNAY